MTAADRKSRNAAKKRLGAGHASDSPSSNLHPHQLPLLSPASSFSPPLALPHHVLPANVEQGMSSTFPPSVARPFTHPFQRAVAPLAASLLAGGVALYPRRTAFAEEPKDLVRGRMSMLQTSSQYALRPPTDLFPLSRGNLSTMTSLPTSPNFPNPPPRSLRLLLRRRLLPPPLPQIS